MDVTADNDFAIDAHEVRLLRKHGANATHDFEQAVFGDFASLEQIVLDELEVDLGVGRRGSTWEDTLLA